MDLSVSYTCCFTSNSQELDKIREKEPVVELKLLESGSEVKRLVHAL